MKSCLFLRAPFPFLPAPRSRPQSCRAPPSWPEASKLSLTSAPFRPVCPGDALDLSCSAGGDNALEAVYPLQHGVEVQCQDGGQFQEPSPWPVCVDDFQCKLALLVSRSVSLKPFVFKAIMEAWYSGTTSSALIPPPRLHRTRLPGEGLVPVRRPRPQAELDLRAHLRNWGRKKKRAEIDREGPCTIISSFTSKEKQ